MKALIISEEQSVLSQMDSILKANGIDCIQYTWLMKALDNLEEIHPALIIVNATEYPRHWKTLAQFVRTSFSDIRVILFTPEGFSDEESKKADELGIVLRFSSFDELSMRIGECTGMPQTVSSEPKAVSDGDAEEDCEIPTVESILQDRMAERSACPADLQDGPSEDFVLLTVETVFSSAAEDFVLYTCDSIFDGLYETESQSCGADEDEKKDEASVSAPNDSDEARSRKYFGSLLKKIQELNLV